MEHFWSHTYNDWSQVNPPSPLSEMGNKGMNLDWKRFITDQTISFIDNETAPLKKITPNIPVTTNMMAGNPLMDPFAGFDYQKVARHLDFISWDSYPAWGNDSQTTEELGRNVGLIHDFFRSLKHQNFLVMENPPSRVNWHNFDRAKDLECMNWLVYRMLHMVAKEYYISNLEPHEDHQKCFMGL